MPEQTFPVNAQDVLEVDASGYPVPVLAALAANVTVVPVAASVATSVLLLAANTLRKGALFFNYSAQPLYLKLGSFNSSQADYSVLVESQGYYELPPYTGAVYGIWAFGAAGGVQVTELS